MKTPLWDIEPFPTLLFDPNFEHARELATGLRKAGLPVEVAPNAAAMLLTARDRYFRTLVVYDNVKRMSYHPLIIATAGNKSVGFGQVCLAMCFGCK